MKRHHPFLHAHRLVRRRGFTLIELIVVMAILGILVLLAAPRLVGYTAHARETRIMNDIRVAEAKAEEALLVDGTLPDTWTPVTHTELAPFLATGTLYDVTGELAPTDSLPTIGGTYYRIPNHIATTSIKSKLPGTFFATPTGAVFYAQVKTDSAPGDVDSTIPKDYKLATDVDFEWVELPTDNLHNNPHTRRLKEPLILEKYPSLYDFHAQLTADYAGLNPGMSDSEAINHSLYVEQEALKQLSRVDDSGYFRYVGTEPYVIIPDTIRGTKVTRTFGMFSIPEDQDPATVPPLLGVATDNPAITTMAHMFAYRHSPNLDVKYLKTQNVTDMDWMFHFADIAELELSGRFDTSHVKTMVGMFWGLKTNQLGIATLDTSQVGDMMGMFFYTRTPKLDVSNLDTSQVGNFEAMFSYSSGFKELDLSGFNTKKAYNMNSMFKGSEAKAIHLQQFDTANVLDMSHMFREVTLKNLDLSHFDTRRVIQMHAMFREGTFESIDLSSFETPNLNKIGAMFYQTVIETVDLSSFSFDHFKKGETYGPFDSANKLKTVYVRSQTHKDLFLSDPSHPATLTIRIK